MPKTKVAYFTHFRQNVIDLVVGMAPEDFEVIGKSNSISEGEKIEIAKDADFLLLHGGKLSEQLLRTATKVKMLQLLSAGFDNVDLPLMKELGIPVSNVGGANRQGVAEMAITLMLGVYRKLVEMDEGVRAGKWLEQISSGFDTFELNGRTVGIVGFGKIGQMVAKYLRGFENTILYYDVVDYPDAEKEYKAKRVSMEELLKQSDIVTIHVPLLEENYGLIGERELNMMKPTAVLVNTSRGPVVNEKDLIVALEAGRIRGAGLDVFEQEPINKDNPLLKLKNVVLTPHGAGGTYDSWPRRAQFAYENMQRVLRGEKPQSVVQE